MPDILVADGRTLFPADKKFKSDDPMFSILDQFGKPIVHETTKQEDVITACAGHSMLLNNKVDFNAAILEALARPKDSSIKPLKYIGILATGYDCVDIDAASRFGVTVCNASGYGTDAVADYVLAAIAEMSRGLGRYASLLREGMWGPGSSFSMPLGTLNLIPGKDVGVVGFGRIGKAVALRCMALGQRVTAYDTEARAGEWEHSSSDLFTFTQNLEEVLTNKHFVSLHCSYERGAAPTINEQTLAMMSPYTTLINAARGGLVDLQAVIDAIKAKVIRSAVIDCFIKEPPDEATMKMILELLDLGGIATPHVAWYTEESIAALWQIVVENIIAFIAGRPINVVNRLPIAA